MPHKEAYEPWGRQPKESEKAYEAFAIYRDMGVGRTVTAVVKQLGKSRNLIDRWKKKYEWSDRVRSYDAHLEEQARTKAVKDKEKMISRHIKIAMQVQEKALLALNSLDVKDMTAKDIKEFIKMSTELERLNRLQEKEEKAAAGSANLADSIVSAWQKRKGGGEDD